MGPKFKGRIRKALIETRARIGFDPSDSILLTGAGRSGTTWLAEMLAQSLGAALLFEPDHPRRGDVPIRFEAEHGTSIFDSSPTAVAAMYSGFLRGQGAGNWSVRDLSSFVRSSRLVVKSIQATPLLVDLRASGAVGDSVVIIRHPCAVVSSQLRATNFRGPSDAIVKRMLNDYPQLADFVGPNPASVARFAIGWVSRYQPLVKEWPKRTHLVAYETLQQDPYRAMSRLLESLGAPAVADKPRPDQATHTDWDSDLEAGAAQLAKWTSRLQAEEVAVIVRVAHLGGIAMYDQSLLPTSKRLDGP